MPSNKHIQFFPTDKNQVLYFSDYEKKMRSVVRIWKITQKLGHFLSTYLKFGFNIIKIIGKARFEYRNIPTDQIIRLYVCTSSKLVLPL